MSDCIKETLKFDHGIEAEIHYDHDAQNPRHEWDNLGTMVCWHSRSQLGDKDQADSPEGMFAGIMQEMADDIDDKSEAFRDIVNEILRQTYKYDNGKVEYTGREMYKEFARTNRKYNSFTLFDFVHDTLADDSMGRSAKSELIRYLKSLGLAILPLYLYDHGGMTISTSPFSCPWDSGFVGHIYITPKRVKDTWPNTAPEELTKRAYDRLQAEVDVYDLYLTGQAYGYIINTPDEDHVDSCWGFFGDDEVKNAAKESAQYYVEKYADPARMAGSNI